MNKPLPPPLIQLVRFLENDMVEIDPDPLDDDERPPLLLTRKKYETLKRLQPGTQFWIEIHPGDPDYE